MAHVTRMKPGIESDRDVIPAESAVVIPADRIRLASAQAYLIEINGKTQWLPAGAVKSVGPDPSTGGILLKVERGTAMARGLI